MMSEFWVKINTIEQTLLKQIMQIQAYIMNTYYSEWRFKLLIISYIVPHFYYKEIFKIAYYFSHSIEKHMDQQWLCCPALQADL